MSSIADKRSQEVGLPCQWRGSVSLTADKYMQEVGEATLCQRKRTVTQPCHMVSFQASTALLLLFSRLAKLIVAKPTDA